MTNLQTFGLFPCLPRTGKGYRLGQVGLWKTVCIVPVFCVAIAVASQAQTFSGLASFDGTNGADSQASLVQGLDGNFYGTTTFGGTGDGTVFEITPAGSLAMLHRFVETDGAFPEAGLVQATNGKLYGTTVSGGSGTYYADGGTVFEITAAGKLTTLYSFCSQTNCSDGYQPYAGLVQATNGNFYGTTESGGANDGQGTVFEITAAGKLTTLYTFCSQTNCTDGSNPTSGLVQATNGNFYGTTEYGGANGWGTVFKITPAGKLTTLYSFCTQQPGCTDGYLPYAGLVQATNGNFYGTTEYGGANGQGTVFEITPAGKLTTLYSFCSQTDCTDGSNPTAALMQATDGNFYGTTQYGGAGVDCVTESGCGTIFEITPAGMLTTLYSFCSQTNCADGYQPYAGLVQATDGNFYGTTYTGGDSDCNAPYGCGTVFGLSVGLTPFVETLPTSGKVGATVIILGNNLTGATSVSFDGTAATFTVVSAAEINTTVPAGATTGTVSVTTPGGTLNSNVAFRVTPQITSFTPTSGAVGTVVTITGVSLTQTTSVTFGGVKAPSFTVNSDTQVTVTVPTGAKTGKIGITTPGGTATSTASFTVT